MDPKQDKPTEVSKELLEQLNRETTEMDQDRASGKIATMTSAATGSAKDNISAILTEATRKGIMPKQALHLGDDTMEAIYGQGYNLYNQGRYKEASYIFRLLMLLDYMTPKYMLGLAASLHRLKDYKNAANVYLLCGSLDAKNPLPHYHAADCYVQLDVPIMAIFSLGVAIEIAGDQPQYSIVKERATLMREALDKQVKEQAATDKTSEKKTTPEPKA